MNIVFTLTMPGCGSWNGKWSGEGKLYAEVRKLGGGKKSKERADKIIADSPYRYSWSDGWAASIEAKEVSGPELRRINKTKKGFCGYEWMVDSILARGKILADHEIKEVEAV